MIIILIIYAGYHMFYNEEKEIKVHEPEAQKEKIVATDLRLGILKYDTINPIISQNRNIQEIARLVFEPLINLTQDFQLEPCLAKEWSQLDNLNYVIKLQEEVTWQDGYNVDADDVIFTIERIKEAKTKSIYYYNIENIASVKKIDENTVKITIKKEDPYFEYNLIFPIMSSKYYTDDNFTKAEKNKNPVGTGMYYIADKKASCITLKPNVSWWKKQELAIDNIQVNVYQTMNEELEAFKDGNVDMITSSNVDIEEYLKDETYQKREFVNRNYKYIVMNCAQPALKNKEVRQAINNAIGQEAICRDISKGKYRASYFPLDFGCYLYDETSKPKKMSAKEIQSMLKKSKWKLTNHTWRKVEDGAYQSLTFDLLVNEDDQEEVKVAEIVKAQLQKIDIQVEVVKRGFEQYQKMLERGNYDLTLIGKNFAYSPSLQSYFGKDNQSNYSNKEMTKLLTQLEKEDDKAQAKEISKEIQALYEKEVPSIGLYYDTMTVLYSNNLRGTITPTSYNLFYNIEGWYREYEK